MKFPGMDISQGDVVGTATAPGVFHDANTADKCQQYCLNNPACNAYVWDGGTDCWLKSTVTDPIAKSGRNTYIKVLRQ